MATDGASSFLLGATVATGFERTAHAECIEKLGPETNASVGRGRIYFQLPLCQLKKALELRSVDHLFVVVRQLEGLNLQQEKDQSLEELCCHLIHSDWTHAVHAWTVFKGLEFTPTLLTESSHHDASTSSDPNSISDEISTILQLDDHSAKRTEDDRESSNVCSTDSTILAKDSECSSNSDIELPESELHVAASNTGSACAINATRTPTDADSVGQSRHQKRAPKEPSSTHGPNSTVTPYLPTFRVTGHRVGNSHSFSSQEAAGKLGEYLIRCYGWPVSMKQFEMEVLVNVHENDASLAINLTAESMHKRNIVHFGPTTLRSTLAHCLLRLCEPQLGDVICDPMCGGGSIPIEGALNWCCYFLGGDNHDIACLHSRGNVQAVGEKNERNGVSVDVLRWDVTNLPLRSNSVDVIVTDMPFGKRMGSRLNNWELYRRGLNEMGRVCRQGTGRAVLLTQDKKCMAKQLVKLGAVWKKKLQLVINIGGLFACVYVLQRRGNARDISPK